MNYNNESSRNLVFKIQDKIKSKQHFCSFEISPPKSSSDLAELLKCIKGLQRTCSPAFYSITWHLRDLQKPTQNTRFHPLQLVSEISGHENDILLNLAAASLSKEIVLDVLNKAYFLGVKSIFALRGDCLNEKEDFQHGIHLVQFIREHYGNQFVICVAGYPMGHPDAESYDADLKYLKEKVDAGADFIITQILFEAQIFIKFVQDCRKLGITVPIIAGILPIQDFASLQHISQICHLKIPQYILDAIEPIKDDTKSVMNFGIHHAVEMSKQILLSNASPGIHFFTLNREFAVLEVCKQLGLSITDPVKPLQQKAEDYEDSNKEQSVQCRKKI